MTSPRPPDAVIILARHGETADNVPPQRIQGWRDVPLNDRGREQARALADAAAMAAGDGGIAANPTDEDSVLARCCQRHRRF